MRFPIPRRLPLCARSRQPKRYTTGASPPSPSKNHNPLKPTIPISDLGLPVTPLPPPLSSIPKAKITRATLQRLCQMSALNPPAEGSEEETKLLDDLGELVGLMDLVGSVEVEGEVRELLTEGVGEVVFGGEGVGEVVFGDEEVRERRGKVGELEERREGVDEDGRRLLEYATRRVGEFYGFRTEKK